ncbi:MAG: L-seryl-tRNA(Sec) selenium transferase, partial [Thermodesulfobacteriota bacterium]
MKKDEVTDRLPTGEQQRQLRLLPGVDRLLVRLQAFSGLEAVPVSVLTEAARKTVAGLRQAILKSKKGLSEAELAIDTVVSQTARMAKAAMKPNLKPLINATGVVIHTNLGRSPLSKEAIDHLLAVASGYSNLEFDLSKGERGIRYAVIEDLLCELTGAQAAMAVNNNAGAVLLAVETFARDREVIVSRGELVEIGGSFRIPDVIRKSGAVLKEVGTTNRTHPRDYENAISDKTGLLLKVHTSNYGMVGFTAEVDLGDLVELGSRHKVPVMHDLGSGTLIDFKEFGFPHEPTVPEIVATGADVVTFSGDKLLGGPQAGMIVGKKEAVAAIRANPLTRALRIDKLTLAALEMTLRTYRDKPAAIRNIPTLRMLTEPVDVVEQKAETLAEALKTVGNGRLSVEQVALVSKAGGGSLPFLEIPSSGVAVLVEGISANRLENLLRAGDPPLIGRIEQDRFVM